MNPNEWAEKNYELQSQHEAEYKLPMMFWMPDGVDTWLHNRKYEQLHPLFETFPGSTWLTIGDGRYGSDAYYLQTHGMNAAASSISDATLKEAVDRGYIKSFKVENAENMKSGDGEYDFILCKESYHHFPRPPLALYEMLRVASKAVILVEPLEGQPRFFDWLKGTMIKKLIRGDQSALYEPSGNFIYRISIREIEKMMTAINIPTIAVKSFNTFYLPKLASQKYGWTTGTLLTKLAIFLQNMLSFLHLMNYGLATVIVFKIPITLELRNELSKKGFSLIDLPKNPYLY